MVNEASQQSSVPVQKRQMADYLNPEVRNIKPSGIRRFFDVVSTRKDVITLGVGEPDSVTPWHVREAAVMSLERGKTQYTSNAGMPELRDAICNYLDNSFQVSSEE